MSKPAAIQSAFKQLFTEMLNQGGDFKKVGKDLKKPLKIYVKESYPYFLVTDGYFFVQAYFTKEAIAEYKAKFRNLKITELKDKVLVFNSWTLEMKKVNSDEVFTSYANIEMRLIVNSFKPNLNESLQPTRFPINLFRDDDIKTQIQQFRHALVRTALAQKAKGDATEVSASADGVGSISDFSLKEESTAVVILNDIYAQEQVNAPKSAEPALTPAPAVVVP